MKYLALHILFLIFSINVFAEVKVGSQILGIKLLNQEAKTLDLEDELKTGKVLIYFFPKADTPGCTAQACSLRDAYEKIQKAGVKIFGVSTDLPEKLLLFKNKYHIPFQFLSDSKEDLSKILDVPVHFGFATRQAFLLDKGKIIWLDRSASTKEQADDVLKFLGK